MDSAQPQVPRLDYTGEGLTEADLAATPLEQAQRWLAEAVNRRVELGLVEPSELAVATVDGAGRSNVRVVLMRFLDALGPGFVTDTASIKASEISAGGGMAAALTWSALFRAIRFRGTAEAMPQGQLDDYFRTRPWGSRISAWASHQSAPVADRNELEATFAAYAERWPDRGGPDDVPIPPTWGGYRLIPDEVEFWAGRASRLHDRLVFTRVGAGGLDVAQAWQVFRRQP